VISSNLTINDLYLDVYPARSFFDLVGNT